MERTAQAMRDFVKAAESLGKKMGASMEEASREAQARPALTTIYLELHAHLASDLDIFCANMNWSRSLAVRKIIEDYLYQTHESVMTRKDQMMVDLKARNLKRQQWHKQNAKIVAEMMRSAK